MKKNLFFLFLIITTGLGFSQHSDIYYKIKISYSKPDDLLKLSNNGVCIDHGLHKKNHFFISDFSGEDLQKISSLGFSYEILIDDVIKFYQNRNKSKYPRFKIIPLTIRGDECLSSQLATSIKGSLSWKL